MADRTDAALWHHPVAVLILATLCVVVYSNTITSPFFFDDERNIIRNPHIRIDALSFAELRDAGFASPAANRPVANITFALNYYLGGYDTTGYHVVNIAIHLTSGILIYFLALALLAQAGRLVEQLPPTIHSHSIPSMALLSASLFIVHPIQVQSVTYIVQRMNSLATMFFLAALLFYVHARITRHAVRRWVLFAGSLVSWVLALGSKEIALTLPLIVLLYEWFFPRNLRTDWLRSIALYLVGGAVVCVLVALFYLEGDPLRSMLSYYGYHDFTVAERLLTQSRVILFYVSLILLPLPSRLNVLHSFTISRSLIDPVTTLLAVVTILAAIGAALWCARRRRLVSFCVLWFFVTLSVESSVIGLAMVFEHRLYLPLAGCVWLGAALLFHFSSARSRWPAVAGIGIVGLLALGTYARNGTWRDDLTLWSDVVAKNPETDLGRINLGLALESRGRFDEAMEQFREALRIEPDSEIAHNNLGTLLKDRRRFAEAIRHFEIAVEIEPRYANAHYNLGNALFATGKIGKAVEHFERAVELVPDFAMAHYNLGTALVYLGRDGEAIEQLEEAIRLEPGYVKARWSLGTILADRGKLADAAAQFSEVVRLVPDGGEGHFRLGEVLARQGRLEQALVHLEESVRLDPTDSTAQRQLSLVRRQLERPAP